MGGHQWILPSDPAATYSQWTAHPNGLIVTAWKPFNRGWLGAGEEYFRDSVRYPNHPRRWGENVIPLVDEDNDSKQIGWVRIHQQTQADESYTTFAQFAIQEMFEARALPGEYA